MNTKATNINKPKVNNLPPAVPLLLILLMVSSCKKFLASYSQNQTFIETAADLDELLVGEVYGINMQIIWMNTLDDDIEENPATNYFGGGAVFMFSGVHHWQSQPFAQSNGAKYEDNFYVPVYKKIASTNTILFNIPSVEAKGEPKDTLRRISGEALFMRAYYYFLLANFYGRPYSIATAATDYCVPLKTDPAVDDRTYSRSTTKQVFDQILADLLQSEKQLQGFNLQSRHRVNQAATQALLSRVYLYMGDYTNAIVWADKAIDQGRYRLTDLNAYTPANPVIAPTSPEIMFSMPLVGQGTFSVLMNPANISGLNNFKVSGELLNTYSTNDLRVTAFFQKSGSGEVMARKSAANPGLQQEFMVRLPEIYLNKAEALAVQGREAEAITTVQELRKKRFKPEHLSTPTESGAALVNFIREERRRELCFEMQRWFDLRRYGVNDKFPFGKATQHPSHAYNSSGRYVQGYFELKPYEQDKAAYVMPVPISEIDFNNGAISNEVRPERQLIR